MYFHRRRRGLQSGFWNVFASMFSLLEIFDHVSCNMHQLIVPPASRTLKSASMRRKGCTLADNRTNSESSAGSG